MKTVLERAEGSALDIIINREVPIDSMITLLSPRAQQIRYLKFARQRWADVIKFAGIDSGRFPLLHTLKISSEEPDDGPNAITPPSSPIFGSSVNVKQFVLRLRGFNFLRSFIFPHLTTFELSANMASGSNVSDLLNFLEASPMLRTVEIRVLGGIALRDTTPQQPIVVLPNVETFLLHGSDGASVYTTAAHISCPCSRDTSLVYRMSEFRVSSGETFFPPPALLDSIARQYTRSPFEEVVFQIVPLYGLTVGCFLTFRSSDASDIKFGYELLCLDRQKFYRMALLEAARSIRAHPLLSRTKPLRITYRDAISDAEQVAGLAQEVGELFGSMGPLDELTIEGCDLNVYLAPFLCPGEESGLSMQPIKFPIVKRLTISRPLVRSNGERCMEAIVELAKSQRAKGIPFERVTVRGSVIPATMAERLMEWVGEAICCELSE